LRKTPALNDLVDGYRQAHASLFFARITDTEIGEYVA
jgi:hypothetical protein